ncbi:Ras family protein, partial [Pelomyxa schiedti]
MKVVWSNVVCAQRPSPTSVTPTDSTQTQNAASDSPPAPTPTIPSTATLPATPAVVSVSEPASSDSQAAAVTETTVVTSSSSGGASDTGIMGVGTRRNSHCSVVYRGTMYVYGGFDGTNILGDIISLDLSRVLSCYGGEGGDLPMWDTVPQINPPPPRHSSSAVLYKNSMYVFGGATNKGTTNDLLSFSFLTRTWTVIAPTTPLNKCPLPRCGHCSVLWRHSMLVHGGFCDQEHSSSDSELWMFDLVTLNWECCSVTPISGATLPCLPHFHSAVIHEDKLYILDGKSTATPEYKSPHYFIDLKTLQLQFLPTPPRPQVAVFGHTCAWVLGTSLLIYVGGFYWAGKRALHDVALFDVATNHWTEIASEGDFCDLYFHVLAYWQGNVFIMGGIPGKSALSTLDRFWHCSMTGFPLDNISKLPDDVLCNVIQRLSPLEIVSIRRVNKRLYNFCYQESVLLAIVEYHKIPLPSTLKATIGQFERCQQLYYTLVSRAFPNRMWLPMKNIPVPPAQPTKNRESFLIAVLGAGGVGKTCLVVQFVQGIFVERADPYIDDSYRKQIEIENRQFMLEIYDTAGTEQFTAMRDLYMKNAMVCIICFSLVCRPTLDMAQELLEQVYSIKDTREAPVVLCGCKCDLAAERQITLEGLQMAQAHNIPYVETSGRNKINCDTVFTQALRTYLNITYKNGPPAQPQQKCS